MTEYRSVHFWWVLVSVCIFEVKENDDGVFVWSKGLDTRTRVLLACGGDTVMLVWSSIDLNECARATTSYWISAHAFSDRFMVENLALS